MSLWYNWQSEWLLYEKVEFDGATRQIIIHSDVSELDIRNDVYSAWVRWMPLRNNARWLQAMRYTGLDVIPGGQTGDVYFLRNGWKLIIDLNKVKVSGVLYSDDYTTAYYNSALNPLYPATVSALVNTVTNTQNVVTGDLSSVPTIQQISNVIPTSASNANAVWSHSSSITVITQLLETWQRLGLDPNAPMTTNDTTISFASIVQAMVEVNGAVTVTRQ